MTNHRTSALCEQVTEQMTSVLDGSATSLLLDHVATCDTCRDARYEAERGELLMSESGSDFDLPEGFAKRLEQKTRAAVTAAETETVVETQPEARTETKTETASAAGRKAKK